MPPDALTSFHQGAWEPVGNWYVDYASSPQDGWNTIRSGYGNETVVPVPADYEGDGPIRFGRYEVHVHHTPGHCPGGVCLAVKREGSADHTLFVGDTLFAGSIGRTDLPGGNLETLLNSIRKVLFAFPDTTPVYSGHGEATTIGRERKTNPFLAM